MPGHDVFISDPWPSLTPPPTPIHHPLLHPADTEAIVHGDPERGAFQRLPER